MQMDNCVLSGMIAEVTDVGAFWGTFLDKHKIYVNVFWAYFPKGGMHEGSKT